MRRAWREVPWGQRPRPSCRGFGGPNPMLYICLRLGGLPLILKRKVCTGISGELIQANKTLADNPGLMSEDVRQLTQMVVCERVGYSKSTANLGT